MRHLTRNLVVGTAMLLGVAACANLDVKNTDNPDRAQALATPTDVESLISASFNSWFDGAYNYTGPGLFLSNQSFQHTAPWANAAMYNYGAIPRIPIVNDAADQYYQNWTRPWTYNYRAIAAVSDGLRAFEDTTVTDALGADTLRDQAYGYFVLGLAHASLAVLYDQAFVVDQTTDVSQPQTLVSYDQVMQAAMGYWNKALALCAADSFAIPTSWMSTDAPVTNTYLAQIIHSEMARYMVAVARNSTARKAVDWASVVSNIDAGITQDFNLYEDSNNGWENDVVAYASYPGWQEMPYYIYGMADQSGNYQRWLNLPLTGKLADPAGGNIVIVTPDQRFPQGTTIAEQDTTPGSRFTAMEPTDASGVWKHPERGQWRWSWYYNPTGLDYVYAGWVGDIPEIPMKEMDFLRAEADYNQGDMAGAATIINVTRTAAGLNATDANGTNTSCVPKLPDNSCGSLWEMLKWEKRMEIQYYGLYGAPWWFDSRGWGDLYAGTPIEWPAPCKEMQEVGILPCYTFGGPGADGGAPVSTYNFPAESG